MVASSTLEDAGLRASAGRGCGLRVRHSEKGRIRDVNREGFDDRVLQFRKRGIAVTDTEVCLFGVTRHETFFSGCGAVSLRLTRWERWRISLGLR